MLDKLYSYLRNNQVILALVIITVGWLLFTLRGVFVVLFLSYIIMAALLPFVHMFKRAKFPLFLSVLIPYLTTLLLLFILVFPLIPFFTQQVQALFTTFPTYLNNSLSAFGLVFDTAQIQAFITQDIASIGQNAFEFTSKIFGGLFSVLSVMIISFYLLMYHDRFHRGIARLFKRDSREAAVVTMGEIDDKLGAWLRGQIVLCFAIGLLTWVLLTLINLPYALPLALIAGILEALPTLGPILSAVPAIVVAITISPNLALIIAVAYFGIQFLENHILVPKIMQHAVGLNPIIVIIGIMIGGELMGIAGALLSIPFISFFTVLFSNLKDFE